MEPKRPVMMDHTEWFHLRECPTCKAIGDFTIVPGKDNGWVYWLVAFVTLPIWIFVPGIPFMLLFVRIFMSAFDEGCICRRCGQKIIFRHSSGHA